MSDLALFYAEDIVENPKYKSNVKNSRVVFYVQNGNVVSLDDLTGGSSSSSNSNSSGNSGSNNSGSSGSTGGSGDSDTGNGSSNNSGAGSSGSSNTGDSASSSSGSNTEPAPFFDASEGKVYEPERIPLD